MDQKLVFEQIETRESRDVTFKFAKQHAFASRDYLLHVLYWIKIWTPA